MFSVLDLQYYCALPGNIFTAHSRKRNMPFQGICSRASVRKDTALARSCGRRLQCLFLALNDGTHFGG
jgi:hypothetical protein